jgi:enterochelin esterase-like enzyme
MSFGAHASRTQLWLESLGEWSWPGASGAAVDIQPPSWVPAFPPRLEAAVASSAGAARWGRRRARTRRLGFGAALSGLAALCAGVALNGPAGLERVVGIDSGPAAGTVQAADSISVSPTPPLPPTLSAVSHDAAGSSIDAASYPSVALEGPGSFLVYLPPGYGSTTGRYPVLYLLHGQNGHATAFLEVGLQETLDRLIARGTIPPLIAVMIQDRSSLENWRDIGARKSASYVVEVQTLVDRMLPTIPARAARAIAGNSMGGFGAMHVALANPLRFSVVESWLGYFNNLQGELRADQPILSRLGLHAFLYGAESDPVADPAEDPAFAAELRAAGAHAESAVYPGGHSLDTVREHLSHMLTFAGRNLARSAGVGAR